MVGRDSVEPERFVGPRQIGVRSYFACLAVKFCVAKLIVWRRWAGRHETMPVQEAAMPLFQLLEFGALLRSEKWLHVAMRLLKDLVNIPHGLFAFCFQLRSGTIDNG